MDRKTLKKSHKSFQLKEQNERYGRENRLLLEKLVDINKGRKASVNGPATYKQKKNFTPAPNSSFQSLNISYVY